MDLQFFTVPEAAKKLAVSPQTLRRLIRKGEVRPVRIGGGIRVTSLELQRLAEGKPC